MGVSQRKSVALSWPHCWLFTTSNNYKVGFKDCKNCQSYLSCEDQGSSEYQAHFNRHTKAFRCGSYSKLDVHISRVREKLFQDLKNKKVPGITERGRGEYQKPSCRLYVAICPVKTRVIIDFLFDLDSARGKDGGINLDRVAEDAPGCFCREALPNFLAEVTGLQIKFWNNIISLSRADVWVVFRTVRVNPDKK